MPVASGFPWAKGRVAVVSTSAIFANDAVRVCEWGADVAVARILEYVRPDAPSRVPLVFDEFHHGFGMHGGSLTAVSRYLARTASGHFLVQALVAGLLLLLALAPRPLPPRDPVVIARRSPLDHADALGHAYADVAATRTAAQHLVSGVRRRVGRTVAGQRRRRRRGVSRRRYCSRPVCSAPPWPCSGTRISTPVPPQALLDVSEALRAIEQQLSMPPQRAP